MNTIRELKQQEKYKSMLKRKNKEKKIYKDKNASLQLEKQRLYIALRNKDKEIERLNMLYEENMEFKTTINSNIQSYNKLSKYSNELEDRIEKAIKYIEERYNGEVLTHTFDKDNVGELLEILKGSDKE